MRTVMIRFFQKGISSHDVSPHTQRQGKKPVTIESRGKMIPFMSSSDIFRHSLLELHSLVNVKSGRKICVTNGKKKEFERSQTLTIYLTLPT